MSISQTYRGDVPHHPLLFADWVKDRGSCLWSQKIDLISTSLAHITRRSVGLHPELLEQIVPCPPTSESLAVDIHRDSEQREQDRGTSENIHDLFWSIAGDPWVRVIRETVKHKVLHEEYVLEGFCMLPGSGQTYLEQHVHDENFVALISEGVETIRQSREDADQYAHHHQTLKESTEHSRVTVLESVTEEEHSKGAEDAGRRHPD